VVSIANQEVWGSKPSHGWNFYRDFCFSSLANSAVISTLTVNCQWEDETARERTGYQTSYDGAKKMKLLALYTHGCPRVCLRLA